MVLDLLTHASTVASHAMAAGDHTQYLADLPPITPDQGAPGATAFTKVVGALMFYGLLGGLAGLILSAIAFGVGRWIGNHHATAGGRVGMFASMAATMVVGGGSVLINWAFNLGASITA